MFEGLSSTYTTLCRVAPLVSDDGIPLGALCVLDTVARPGGLNALQHEGLVVLAANVLARLRDSRDGAAWRAAENDARRAALDSDTRFRTLADTMPQMVWSTLPDGYHDYYNARWYEFTGMPEGSTDGAEWNGMFHPDDQDRAWEIWRHSLTTGDPYQIEYRLRHVDGSYRWVLGRALPIRDANGQITRWFGTCTDIHEQKLALEQREIISQELSHRIKNIFSVIAGLIQFAARSHPGFAPVATDLRVIVSALRMSATLERMGDLARHIAEIARGRYPRQAVPQSLTGTFTEMDAAARRLAQRIVTLLESRDLALAEQIQTDDDRLDDLHADSFTAMLGGGWSATPQQTVDVTLLGRFYERFGDHGVSIARRIVFLVTGDLSAGEPLHIHG